MGRVARQWEDTKLHLNRQLLNCMLHAANGALAMHEAWLPPDIEDDEVEDSVGPSGMTGAWGAAAAEPAGLRSGARASAARTGAGSAGPASTTASGGGSMTAGGGFDGSVSDEDVQAHAWVPALLLALLARAHVLHRSMREELSHELLSPGADVEEEEALYELLDCLQVRGAEPHHARAPKVCSLLAALILRPAHNVAGNWPIDCIRQEVTTAGEG